MGFAGTLSSGFRLGADADVTGLAVFVRPCVLVAGGLGFFVLTGATHLASGF